MNQTSLMFFVLCLTVISTKQHDPFEVLIDYQTKHRQSAKLYEKQYNLLPFLVHKNKEIFVYQHHNDKELNVQIIVYWFNENNQIVFPEFNLTQKIRITIEQDVYSKIPVKPVMVKQFLTQSGFTIKVQNGKRYKWTIQTNGKQRKMVQIAVGSQNIEQIVLKVQKKNHTNEIALLRSLKQNLQKAQQNWIKKQQKKAEKNVEIQSMWAWISGIELFSLFGFLAIQLFLFEKFSFSFSVI